MSTKVHMELPDSAVRDAQELTDVLATGSKANTVATALSLTNEIVKRTGKRGELIVKDGHGHAASFNMRSLFGD